ncbi:MAG TPA: thioredoxin domain-containing protein [Actinomycetota bacterium]|nr:thioredoxin domain-containing protein [Actinomycetota bacterium]
MSPNRLAAETSPYLLQHANNPVDWYPWGDEAFEEARRRDVPILLSIGYAACHWCHVMERESFEDAETAQLMNELCVNVKVDREERPDVDSLYMDAVQAMTGHGGWPMTVFMTPDGIPMIGGTYFPPEDRHGMPSFRTVLRYVADLWVNRRPDLLAQGNELIQRISQSIPAASSEPLTDALLWGAARQVSSVHDSEFGGFGRAPKFPQSPVLEFCLRARARGAAMRGLLDTTLRAMALGGIYDQIGGGFSRYAVDRQWLVPHFEKMLYDNAQLARVYLHAWQTHGDQLYGRICAETLDYLLRDMRDDTGALHASEDADSEGEEGKFYVWSHEEFMAVAPEAAGWFGATPEGNFEGHNILTAGGDDPPLEARAKLLEVRSRRVRPAKDDKVLASWNGLAIAALSEAGAALDRPDFLVAARDAASFVLDGMRRDDGRLLHSYRAGKAHIPGLLEDYAYMADGLLALWEATFEPRWLHESQRLAREAIDLFADPRGGGFYAAAEGDDALVIRQKDVSESATPSPGAVLSLVLQRLAVLFDEPDLARPAVDALRVARIYMDRAPQAAATWLAALDFYLSTPKEVVLTGDLRSDAGRELARQVWTTYLPNAVIAGRPAVSPDHPILQKVALLKDRETQAPTAFVCERYVCKLPTSDPQELARQLTS